MGNTSLQIHRIKSVTTTTTVTTVTPTATAREVETGGRGGLEMLPMATVMFSWVRYVHRLQLASWKRRNK